MKLRSVLLSLLAIGAIGGAAALFYAWEMPIPPIDPRAVDTLDPVAVRRGAELALLGDCDTCHTAPGGVPYAGGLAMPTPFGTIYSTNITPDPDTGIGKWSEEAFTRALRSGVDREGRHLYPAFPYDHFTRVTDDDAKALYVFFMSLNPVKATAPANGLPFPLNVRLTLAGWKLLFLRQERFVPDPSKDDVWNRGKYLVDGLGHCGACHSPRNFMGAEKESASFQGGEAEGWHAYAFGRYSEAPIAWTAEALEQYLAEGFHADHGVARGPMAPVVDNLSRVSRADAAAMAIYLASLTPPSAALDPRSKDKQANPASLPQSAGSQAATPSVPNVPGAQLYASACASCHESGRALPLGGVQLSLSTAVAGESPENLLNLIMSGIPAAKGAPGPVMPGFASVMSDDQVVALARHLRVDIAGRPDWPDLEQAVRRIRAAKIVTNAK